MKNALALCIPVSKYDKSTCLCVGCAVLIAIDTQLFYTSCVSIQNILTTSTRDLAFAKTMFMFVTVVQ